MGYPKARAALGNDNAQTKGSSITFSTVQTTFTIFAGDEDQWRITETHDTEEAARQAVNTFCAISPGGIAGSDSVKIPDRSQTLEDLGGKEISELIGENVKITWEGTDGSVEGDINKISDWKEFSSEESEQSGNYFPVKLDDKYVGKPITVLRSGKTAKTETDTQWVIRIPSNQTTVTFKDEGEIIAKLNFTKATLKDS